MLHVVHACHQKPNPSRETLPLMYLVVLLADEKLEAFLHRINFNFIVL
jgi:hypothetical protein